MRKSADKVALVALIILGVISMSLEVVLTVFTLTIDGVTRMVIFIILATLFLIDAVYLLWSIFSSGGNVKSLVLFADDASTTKTTIKVIRILVADSARRVGGASIKKVKVSQNEAGIKLTITLSVIGAEVEETVDTLRCFIADTFIKVLGIRFDIIDFNIKRLKPKYVADEALARAEAVKLQGQRQCSQQYKKKSMTTIFESAEEKKEKDQEIKDQEIAQSIKEEDPSQEGSQPEQKDQSVDGEQPKSQPELPISQHKGKGKKGKKDVATETKPQDKTTIYADEVEVVSQEEQNLRRQEDLNSLTHRIENVEYKLTDQDDNDNDKT
ncbi:MAG: hypothetical protein RR248_01135 [Clostridia bacterium]